MCKEISAVSAEPYDYRSWFVTIIDSRSMMRVCGVPIAVFLRRQGAHNSFDKNPLCNARSAGRFFPVNFLGAGEIHSAASRKCVARGIEFS
jgi:hypothetical protein